MSPGGELGGLLKRLESLKSEKRRSVAVFDLDDTLLATDRRHLRILREYVAQPTVRLSHGADALRIAELSEGRMKYSIVETARAIGFTDPALIENLREFWFHRFFKNEYLLADHPVPGAPDYCQGVLKRGALVVYFTGRDETMRDGTLAALERWGFPLPDRKEVFLMLKPRFDMPDLDYKRDGLRQIGELGPVAASFENEPAHLNLFQEVFPDSWLFLLETKHSGRPVEPHPSSRRIRDFRGA